MDKMRRLLDKKNKRGYSLNSWIETALFASLFVLLFVAVIAEMNVKYNKNINGDLGLESLANQNKNNMSDYQATLQKSVASGEGTSTGLGLSLTTTWNIITSGANIIWGFLIGNWIETLCGLIGLPMIVGVFLRIIFVISIGLIILRLVLKINP